jgi:pimeloyl-ACP methyl ester carboxylesterase
VIIILIFAQFYTVTPKIKQEKNDLSLESVALIEKIELGKMDQWLLIRGRDVSNPILLWLHGGPGAAQMPVSRHYNAILEEEFIVVHWDQRGAGKSNPIDFDESTMSLEQYREDALDLTAYLKKKFNKEKIYILGHSWGTIVGTMLANSNPQDYYAYIAVSQVVNHALSNNISYFWLKDQIEQKAIKKDMARFQKLGAPPFNDHDTYVSFARLIESYNGGMDISFSKLALIALLSPEYRLSDYVAYFIGAQRGSGPMWDQTLKFNALNDYKSINTPVYFIAGANDYNTPLELVKQYYELLEVDGSKELIVFEKSSHTPFFAEPKKFNELIIEIKNKTYSK